MIQCARITTLQKLEVQQESTVTKGNTEKINETTASTKAVLADLQKYFLAKEEVETTIVGNLSLLIFPTVVPAKFFGPFHWVTMAVVAYLLYLFWRVIERTAKGGLFTTTNILLSAISILFLLEIDRKEVNFLQVYIFLGVAGLAFLFSFWSVSRVQYRHFWTLFGMNGKKIACCHCGTETYLIDIPSNQIPVNDNCFRISLFCPRKNCGKNIHSVEIKGAAKRNFRKSNQKIH